jgi:hypothetical protein
VVLASATATTLVVSIDNGASADRFHGRTSSVLRVRRLGKELRFRLIGEIKKIVSAEERRSVFPKIVRDDGWSPYIEVRLIGHHLPDQSPRSRSEEVRHLRKTVADMSAQVGRIGSD